MGEPIINPSNSIDVYSANGTLLYHDTKQLSSDQSRTYNLNLSNGVYFISVSVGSTSNLLHSAGTLSQVKLDSPNYLNWTETKIISSHSYRVIDVMPTIWSTYIINSLPNPYSDSSLIDGTITNISQYVESIQYTGILGQISVNDYLTSSTGGPINCQTRNYIQSQFQFIQGPTTSPDETQTTWVVQRVPDVTLQVIETGYTWPDPVYWNGSYIRVPEC